ncbi:S-layer homology domain-containing protein [Dethiothermospora halolimnae]|uniref:S-layer homology domain-containing protein n=1 Tax=Dethiothermospora halolimnae TaxID=3114390 RepID=UPI003CCC1436
MAKTKRILSLLIVAIIMFNITFINNKAYGEEDVDGVSKTLMDNEVGSYEIIDIENHWAYEEIKELVDKGILKGYKDNTFRPDKYVSRAEFITALLRVVCVLDENHKDTPYGERRDAILESISQKKYDIKYSDLENHWAKNNIAWVKGYIDDKDLLLFENIYSGSEFNPDEEITRKEVVVLTRYFLLPPIIDKDIDFDDINRDNIFYNKIQYVAKNGIMTGHSDGSFRLSSRMTRGDTAVIMSRILKNLKYRKDFLKDKENYIFVYNTSSNKVVYPTFLTDELYNNPDTELDQKYIKILNSEEINIEKNKQSVMEYEILEIIEKLKNSGDSRYYTLDEIKGTLKKLEKEEYWNKAGLYYYSYKYNIDGYNTIETLIKAENNYDYNKNGNEDIGYIYTEIINYYINNKDIVKVKEYIGKLEKLYDSVEKIGNDGINKFYLKSAKWLDNIEEYQAALGYVNKAIDNGVGFQSYMYLEKGVLMYKAGKPKNEVEEYIKEKLKELKEEQQLYEDALDKYIWFLKYIEKN